MFNEKNDKEYLLLTGRSDRRYFSGADIAEGYALYGKRKVYFTDARYFSAAKPELEKAGTECVLSSGLSAVAEFLKAEKTETLYADFNLLTVKEYRELENSVKKIEDGADYIAARRMIKTEAEIAEIKKACKIAEDAYHAAITLVKEGDTEANLRDKIEKYMTDHGAEGVSFETIVAFGAGAAVPHHVTGGTVLKRGMPILVDMGCKVNGYCSDMTRMAYFGTPSEKFVNAYDAVLKANLKAEELITSGTPAAEADKIARDILTEAGYGDKFTHSLGHGVGLDIHERPAVSPRSKDTLVNGTVFTVEPGVYLDGEFGIRIEDTVYLKNDKVVRFFEDDKNLIIL